MQAQIEKDLLEFPPELEQSVNSQQFEERMVKGGVENFIRRNTIKEFGARS